MYNHKLIFDDQVFESGITIPQNTSDTADTALRVDGTRNRLAVTVTAKTATALADTKKFTITVTESSTEGGSYAAPAENPQMQVTMSGATTYAAGDRIASLVLPENIGKWVKATVATDDAAATGTLDVFLEYLGN